MIKTALLISYHILGSVITILILAEAQKPRRRIGIAEWKVFARLESLAINVHLGKCCGLSLSIHPGGKETNSIIFTYQLITVYLNN